MINQITCNSNNAIQLSRGELLNWLNALLKLNYSKIQQLGTGAAYCQLLDFIYPGKVPLSKVNWKAKFDYEYLNNFKVLQQSFTKLNIMKHIDVEKLVKCKYQDNLEFLQWFKKIFDTTNSSSKQYDAITRRGQKQNKQKEKQKEVKGYTNNSQGILDTSQGSKQGPSTSTFQAQGPENEKIITQEIKQEAIPISQKLSYLKSPERLQENNERYAQRQSSSPLKIFNSNSGKIDERLISVFSQNQNEEKQFYLRKLKEIEYLMDTWDTSRSSQSLIENIRKIILVAPEVDWQIQNGGFVQKAFE